MSADPRFDRRAPAQRPTYPPGTLLRTSPLIPPPNRREPAPERRAPRPREATWPAVIGDEEAAATALPHEAFDAPDGSGLPHDSGEEGGL